MILTSKSESNILYILKNYKKEISLEKKTITSRNLLKKIYDYINESIKATKNVSYQLKETDDEGIIKAFLLNIEESIFMPVEIVDYIHAYINYSFQYIIKINNCIIEINFFTTINDVSEITKTRIYLKNYLKFLKSWLFLCVFYSNGNYESMKFDIYLTPFVKKIHNLSKFKNDLSSIHVNSGYTYTNPINNNKGVVIFRKEEWFKVFLHESMHAFSLDFHNINIKNYQTIMKSQFNCIKSDFNINESYCEFWANVMNLCYYSYGYCNENYKNFVLSFELNIKLEQLFSIMQANKILSFYDLTFDMVISDKENNCLNTLYKENTNVFSYYIIKSILLFNYEKVFQWCNINNLNFIQFKETHNNIDKFIRFTLKLKNDKKYKSISDKYKKKLNNNNLEMSLFEYIF